MSDLPGIVDGLESLGAKNILVPGMPDPGLTPFIQSQGAAAAAEYSTALLFAAGLVFLWRRRSVFAVCAGIATAEPQLRHPRS